jgi:deoxyhypusine synthase
MQVQVFMGNAGDAKTSKLQEIQDELIAAGQVALIIQAGAYAEEGLLQILEVRAAGGQREILVDDCSRLQILKVLEWRSCTGDDPSFDDLVIHLARQA